MKKIGCGKVFETEMMLKADGTYGTSFLHCEEGIGLCPNCKMKRGAQK